MANLASVLVTAVVFVLSTALVFGCTGSLREAQSSRTITSSKKNIGWPTFGGDYGETRSVHLGQVRSDTIHSLRLTWRFDSGRYGKFEATPIVVDRTMYLTLPPDDTVVALDATNGRLEWKYIPKLDPVRVCCGLVNRGVAVDHNTVFVATLDDRLIALDAKTGVLRWQVHIASPARGYSETLAPLAWRGMVFVGVSGGDVGTRGFLASFSESSGKFLWRWWSVSDGWEGRFTPTAYRNIAREKATANQYSNSWREGGGAIWMTPALDPDGSTIYAGVGNPFPVIDDVRRPGDNLYTDSIVALDAKTGKLRWYYQEVPHDRWDYDADSPPVLFELPSSFKQHLQAIGQAGKTGWFYILNRSTGAFIRKSQPFVPQFHMFAIPTAEGALVEPGGGTGAVAPVAFDKETRQVFITAVYQRHFGHPEDPYWLAVNPARYGIVAIDVATGNKRWERWFAPSIEISQLNNGTAGACVADGLVFVGEESTGKFDALDAKTGRLLWQFQTTAGEPGARARRTAFEMVHDWLAPIKHALLHESQPAPSSHIHNSPIAYVIDGTEYVAVGGDAFYRTGDSAGDTLYVFSVHQ